MSNTAKNLIIILGLITVAFAGYYLFSQQSASSLSFDANDEVLENMRANSQLFIERRQRLETIDMNLDFFNDPRFTSLRSYVGPVQERPVGRTDPFANSSALPNANTN